MAFDLGIATHVEDWLATTLTALTHNSNAVFKTVEPWSWQLDAGLAGFGRYAPFAFISFWPDTPGREGDYDLNRRMRFRVLIGVESAEAGVARRGDARHLGFSKIFDLVTAAIDGVYPGESSDTGLNDLYYDGGMVLVDSPKQFAAELTFAMHLIE